MSEPGESIAAYVRVSSASQGHAMQRDAIERLARTRGDRIGRWYSDTRTGATMQRSELDELRRSARMGRVIRLYVFKLDRLTRTGIRDTLELVEELSRNGCQLVTVADGFDFQGPAGEIILAVIAWAAKIERLAIGERISAARMRVEAKGGAWGRPRRMTAADAAAVHRMHAEGKSERQIAMALKFTRGSVARELDRKPSKKPAKKFRPGPLKRRR